MGDTTGISWTDRTFNPWRGCTKVSPGCAHCYAERDYDKRWHRVKWGPGQPRQEASAAYWRKPLAWERQAAAAGERVRVFCASLADWLDNEVPADWLARLLDTIRMTPHLDWQLLTKRPENFLSRIVAAYKAAEGNEPLQAFAHRWLIGWAPENVWVGVSVEDQKRADLRVPQVLKIPAHVRFLSCEPLLGPIDLGRWIGDYDCHACGETFWSDDMNARPGISDHLTTVGFGGDNGERETCPRCGYVSDESDSTIGVAELQEEIHWVISGGESGPQARTMSLDWARSLVLQCKSAKVAHWVKQLGALPGKADTRHRLEDLPPDLRVRRFPLPMATS